MATLSLEHGAYSKLDAYKRMLGLSDPTAFAQIPDDLTLRPEIMWARYKLAHLEKLGGQDDLALNLVGRIGALVATEHDVNPGGEAKGEFSLTVNVVGGPATPVQPKPPEKA